MAGDSFPDRLCMALGGHTHPSPVMPLPHLATAAEIVDQWEERRIVDQPVGLWTIQDILPLHCIKRTFQPSLIRRKRKWGFLVRIRDKDGRKVINRRRQKKRWRLAM